MFDMFTFLRFSQYVLYRRIRVPLQDSIDGAERVDIHASANLRLRYLGQPKMMRALKTQAYSTPLQRTTSHSVSHIQCVLREFRQCFAFVFDQIRYFGGFGGPLYRAPPGGLLLVPSITWRCRLCSYPDLYYGTLIGYTDTAEERILTGASAPRTSPHARISSSATRLRWSDG